MFREMNLKLYDVQDYEFRADGMEKDFPLCFEVNEDTNGDIFSEFCDDSFSEFKDTLAEEGIDLNKYRHFIRMTSSFYLYKDVQLVYFGHEKIDHVNWGEIIEHIVYHLYPDDRIYYDQSTGLIDRKKALEENQPEEIERELKYLSSEFLEDLNTEYHPVTTIYREIEHFKENQVEFFKAYLEPLEEQYMAEKEADEAEEARKSKLIECSPEVLQGYL
jgi:hypothetical protein